MNNNEITAWLKRNGNEIVVDHKKYLKKNKDYSNLYRLIEQMPHDNTLSVCMYYAGIEIEVFFRYNDIDILGCSITASFGEYIGEMPYHDYSDTRNGKRQFDFDKLMDGTLELYICDSNDGTFLSMKDAYRRKETKFFRDIEYQNLLYIDDEYSYMQEPGCESGYCMPLENLNPEYNGYVIQYEKGHEPEFPDNKIGRAMHEAYDAFVLNDFIKGHVSGGIEPPRNIIRIIGDRQDDHVNVGILYKWPTTGGLSDVTYHSNRTGIEMECFTVDKEHIYREGIGVRMDRDIFDNDIDGQTYIDGFMDKWVTVKRPAAV